MLLKFSASGAVDHLSKAESFLHHQSDSAYKYAKLALIQFEEQGDKSGLATAHHHIAVVYSQHGLYNKAIDHYSKAILLFASENNTYKEASTRNKLGEVYYMSLLPEYSLTEYKTARKQFKSIKDKIGEANSLALIGHYFEKQSAYDSALHYQQLALGLAVELEHHESLSRIYGHLGSIYEDLEEYQLARDYFKKALSQNLLTTNEDERIVVLNNLGDAYRKEGRLEEAISYTEEALKLAEKLNHKSGVNRALKDMAKSHYAIGNFKLGFDYLLEALEMNEQVYSEKHAEQLSGLQALNQMAQKESEIQLLKIDNELARTNKNILMATVLLLLVLGAGFVGFQRHKMRQKHKLLLAHDELTQAELSKVKLNEEKLKVELENQELKEQSLQHEINLKNQSLSTHALQIIQKNKQLKNVFTKLQRLDGRETGDLKKQVSKLLKEINQDFTQDKDWEDFKVFFERVHPHFYPSLAKQIPNLSPSEIRLCTLLRLNMSTKDMASILKVAPDSIRIARYRLRKKLPLEEGDSLVKFMIDV